MDFNETYEEWLKTQTKEVKEEFKRYRDIQSCIDNREMPVSQIYYGDKPISKDSLEAVKYTLETLTDKQKDVYRLYHEDKKTQKEVAKILGISQQMVNQHLSAIKNKIEKII